MMWWLMISMMVRKVIILLSVILREIVMDLRLVEGLVVVFVMVGSRMSVSIIVRFFMIS